MPHSSPATPPQPEQYIVRPTAHCPNNFLPVLVYRGVLPEPHNEETTSTYLQRYGWVKKGTWGTITTKHFHPNTHECYGIFQGDSELVFGEGGGDTSGTGARCFVRAGDVVVVPAGVAHASVTQERKLEEGGDGGERYRYIGVYPEGAPKWRNEYGKKPLVDNRELAEEVSYVPVPDKDPISGLGGPLVQIWTGIGLRNT
ncbi:Putative uncharacterized protein YjlB [Colletotrichum destructivum]|uniref:Cupin type-1 domain-containing protein n=1 Tax=Colletotrichum destructivum TaxID=34406 RepID=A0AAX4IXP2_9PEZI|nr:Putative uncharacterized protein YjlB [Colletotrichum destructivum]